MASEPVGRERLLKDELAKAIGSWQGNNTIEGGSQDHLCIKRALAGMLLFYSNGYQSDRTIGLLLSMADNLFPDQFEHAREREVHERLLRKAIHGE